MIRASCSMAGCDRPHAARGLCHIHYQWVKRHDTLPPRTLTDPGETLQFIANALRTNSDECCLWPYGKTKTGGYAALSPSHDYGHLVHRFVCEVTYGPPPFPEAVAAHNCGVPACINPRHLRWDTQKGNAADTLIHGTRPLGERVYGAKLTTAQVLLIRSQPLKSEPILAAEFGVTPATIGNIRNRKTWRHI